MAYALLCPAGHQKVSPETRDKILARVNTDEEALARDAAALRAWVNMQPHLPFLPSKDSRTPLRSAPLCSALSLR